MMENNYGYIYIRHNDWCDSLGICKLGMTASIPDRAALYITSEPIRGFFDPVFRVSFEEMSLLEKNLKDEFSQYQYYKDGGTEFFAKTILTLIEPFFDKNDVHYKRLTEQEIDELVRCPRSHNLNTSYTPRDYQKIIIEKCISHFETQDKGSLVLTCGLGKTLISLWVCQFMNVKKILIGVPNKKLFYQWIEFFDRIFPNIPYLPVSSDDPKQDIKKFLQNNEQCIVITLYASSNKVNKTTKEINYMFDMKINDECHHLTSRNFYDPEKRTYIHMLHIPSKKQLSLTATLKILENDNQQREDDVVISNDNIAHFGEVIERKNLLWAIRKGIICDYVIQTPLIEEEKLEHLFLRFDIREEIEKRLFLSALISLKSISCGHSHHLLIYANSMVSSSKIIKYIQMLLTDGSIDLPELYFSEYHSEINSKEQKQIIDNFEKSKFGIISCVYCLGEGWDFPLLDGVVVAENMSSDIRIVQSLLRPCRKNKNEPNKMNKIILPILNKDDWIENNDNSDLKKVKQVIHQMSLEDETITQKIKVYTMDPEMSKKTNKSKKEDKNKYGIGEYDEEITGQLKLKTIQRSALGITYEKAKRILLNKNIKDKKSYFDLCEVDYRLPKEPDIFFKGTFTNWIDYLNIERKYYDLDTCKKKVNEYLSLHPHLRMQCLDLSFVNQELCKKDALFPPSGLWTDYYNVYNLQNIISFTNSKKKSGALLM